MNSNDIHEAGWLFSFLIEAAKWLNPIIHILGFTIAVWAFRRCGKRGFLVIAFYFALYVFSLLVMPPINRAIAAHRPPNISEETRQKIDEAVKQSTDRVLEQEGHPAIPMKQNIKFPLGPVILVAGIWFVARREPHRPNTAPSVSTT